jgi:hypothetical protein
VAVHFVARQCCDGAQDDLVRQTLECVVVTCCVSGVGDENRDYKTESRA